MLSKGVDPGCGRSGGKELEEVCFCQGRGGMGPESGRLLCDSVQLTPQSGNFIQGSRGSGVQVHMLRTGK